MDEPIRHVTFHPSDVRKLRAMSPGEGVALAAGITDTVMALAKAGGAGRPRFWRPGPLTKS
ncbi:MAG: hypothetical protein WDA16_08560 [Candidatus Thermoplasmatota archaeon]